MHNDQRALAAALFEVFADIADSERQQKGELLRATLRDDDQLQKIEGIVLAQSYLQMGTRRYSVMSGGMASGATDLLRAVAEGLRTTTEPFPLVLARQSGIHPPANYPPGVRVAIGFVGRHSAQGEVATLLHLEDLARGVIEEGGGLQLRTENGGIETLDFRFQGHHPVDLVAEKLAPGSTLFTGELRLL